MNQKKTLFAFLVILCLAIPVTSPGLEASPEFAGGSGTAGDPYQVATWYHLYNLRISWRLSPDKYFILVNDLDENTEGYEELASETANGGAGWRPIGTWVNYFDGVFDGQRHEIRGLRINTAMNEAGLFGRANSSTITNVGLVDVVVRGGANTGALVGYFSYSTMTGCYVTGNVSGGSDTGGLVGENYYGNISNSYFLGRVHGHRVGGIAGQNVFGHISNCYSSGPVSGSQCAGLTASCPYCGWLSTVNNSFWDIETSGTSWSAAGTGKTTAEMKDIATFADAGWDIGTTTLGDPTGGYPFLSWQLGGSPTWLIHDGISPIDYDLSISSTHGGLVSEPGEGTFTYEDGTVVDLVATPDTGYHFVNWTGDTDGIDNVASASTFATISDDYSISANFAIDQYTFTYTAGPGGSITGTTPQTVSHGSDGTPVEAVPDAGYHFVDWSDSSTDNPRTDTNVTADITVTANFEAVAGVQTACVESATGTGEVCITTSHGYIEDLTAMPAIPPGAPADIVFPHGMFSFEVTGLALGQTATITVELPDPVPAGTRWWKEHMGAWYSIPITVVEPNVISFTLTDGVFPGDSDKTEDGVITDPGGPGYPLSLGYTVGWEGQPINKFAVFAPWIGLLAGATAGASLLILRRRQTQS